MRRDGVLRRIGFRSFVSLASFLLLICSARAGDIEDYNKFDKLYREGEFSAALESAQRFIAKYPQSPLMPNALYLAGRLSRDVPTALDNFSKIIVKYPESSVVDNALFMIGQYHYASERFDEALLRFRFLVENYKTSDIMDAAYWWLSRSYRAAGDTVMAAVWERKLTQKYPSSEYSKLLAQGAGATASDGPQMFTVQVGSFTNEDAASALKESLARKGYDVYVTVSESSGKSLYRVRLGSFLTREAAAAELETLREVEGLNGWVTSQGD
jgi:TolA-binding protein